MKKKIGGKGVKDLTPHDNSEKVIVSSELYEGEDKPSYVCSFCNQTLSRLTDAGQNNTTFWCRNCSISFDPEEESLRKVSRLSVPDRNEEPCITSTDYNIADQVGIRHTVPKRGGFAELEKKGIRFRSYNTTEKE